MPRVSRAVVSVLLLLLAGLAAGQSSPSRTLSLRPGWNAVALGAEQIAALNAPGVAGVATYTPSGYVLEAPTEETFNAGPGGRRGFWVFASAATTMTYEPRQDGQGNRLTLAAGWNMVAFPGLTGGLALPQGASPQMLEIAPDGSLTTVGPNQARGDRPYWLFATAPGVVSWASQPRRPFQRARRSAWPPPTPRSTSPASAS